MAQHDYIIANQSGAAFRADLNNALAAIVSQNSGATEPSTTYAYQFWADTTAGVLKQRNAANSAWITLFQLDGEWSTIALENGSAAAPSLYFKDSGTDTGVYSPGTDQVGIATAGVQRVNFNGATEVVFNDGGADIDFRIEGDTEPDLFKIDAGTDQVQVKNLNGGPLAGTRNRIINGDMRIDQRNAGASVTVSTTTGYTLDRWRAGASQNSKYSVQQNAGSVTPPAGFINYLGVTSLSAYSVISTDFFGLLQLIEGFNFSDFGWGSALAIPVTLSFWVRSSLTGTFGGSIQNSAQNRSYPFSYTISSANTWEQKTILIPGDTTGTWLTNNNVGAYLTIGLGYGSTYSGTAGAWVATNTISVTGATSVVGTNGATFYITGVQLEAGTVATPFERRSYGQELALCQRYCWVFGNSDNAPFGSGYETATIGKTSAALPVTMRATPTFSSTAANTFSIIDSGSSGRSGTAIALDLASPTAVAVNLTCSGTTANAACILRTASATATMTFNAEL